MHCNLLGFFVCCYRCTVYTLNNCSAYSERSGIFPLTQVCLVIWRIYFGTTNRIWPYFVYVQTDCNDALYAILELRNVCHSLDWYFSSVLIAFISNYFTAIHWVLLFAIVICLLCSPTFFSLTRSFSFLDYLFRFHFFSSHLRCLSLHPTRLTAHRSRINTKHENFYVCLSF